MIAYLLYKPILPVKQNPKFTCKRDVTIIVPTIDHGDEIKEAISTWMRSNPYEIIFVTIESNKKALEDLSRAVDPHLNIIRVITVPKGNKRYLFFLVDENFLLFINF
jgi:hypothetical protein